MAEHIIGAIADFPPGSSHVIHIRSLQIGVFNVDGTLYALPNICPHQFGPLSRGEVGGTMVCNADTGWRHALTHEGTIVTCPWHRMEFDITTGQALASPKFRVRHYPITVENDQVIVRL